MLARNAAAEERVFVAVLEEIAREGRVEQYGGGVLEDPFYAHGNDFYQGPSNNPNPMAPTLQHAYPALTLPAPVPAPALVPTPTPAPITSAPEMPSIPAPSPAPQEQAYESSSIYSQPARQSGRQSGTKSGPSSWIPGGDEVVVRPAPGPFLYSSEDPEELKRKEEERRQKRREREQDRAQQKEEKAKLKAAQKAEKQLRKAQSQQFNAQQPGTLRNAASFTGSLRRAFHSFKKPTLPLSGLAPNEEDEDEEDQGQSQGRGGRSGRQ